jgi:hypothetical protein
VTEKLITYREIRAITILQEPRKENATVADLDNTLWAFAVLLGKTVDEIMDMDPEEVNNALQDALPALMERADRMSAALTMYATLQAIVKGKGE